MSVQAGTYLAIIEEALAEAGRDALILSALDVQTILDWQRAGIPLAVALKAVRQGALVFERTKRPGAAFPRRVAYFTTWVNKLKVRYRDRLFASLPPGGPIPVAETSPSVAPGDSPARTEQALHAAALRCYDGLGRQLREGAAGTPRFAGIYEGLLAELEARRASLSAKAKDESMDEDRVLQWATEFGKRLVDESLLALSAGEREAIVVSAAASVRERFPLASASAVATKRRVEERHLLRDRHGLALVDMRELTP